MPTPIAMQVRELLLQALVHERGGALVYSTALDNGKALVIPPSH
jgi:hypothetical protein